MQGNANALRQIVLNLVDNGARYGPDQQTIMVGAMQRDGQVELWVEDRGPGVPAAERQRVWNAFVRLDRDRDSVVTGTGLGLTVVRELVQAAFGHVGLDWEKHVVVDPRFIRPAEVDLLQADPSKARAELGWEPKVSFEELVAMMVEADLARLAGNR